MAEIPAGDVTFLFTDVEGSTRLWAADAEATARSFERHDAIIRDEIERAGGYVFGWAGDHFRGAFADPNAAVGAAVAAQDALSSCDWDGGPSLRVRMGLHRGSATERNGDYFGPVPNTAARLEALAAGGQILVSAAVADVIGIETRPLGRHRLRDVPEPMEISQVGDEAFRVLQIVDPSLSTLPSPGSPLIGRQHEISQVRGLLESSPLVTLSGAGGCGKTRLAVEIGYQELPSRADGCYFADLSSVSDGSELPAALAAAVRLELGGSRQGALDQVVAHLALRQALLVLDNCEHIVDECARFADLLLARGGGTAVLATSRELLGVAGEQVVPVGSLDVDGDAPAVQLFVERATAASPAFVCGDDPDDAVRSTVVAICRELDGMPLTIELAAARVAVLTPAEILDRMSDRLRLLSGGRGRQRRRTLQATLDWSYDLLDDDERRFFRRCGVFVGSFDLPGAVAVSGFDDYGAIDLLSSLVAKSLLAIDDVPGNPTTRYRMLETIRIYASDLLARSDDALAAREAHLAWFQSRVVTDDFAEAADLHRAGEIRADWSNLASALEYALPRGDDPETGASGPEIAAHLAFGCQGLWESKVPAIEGRRWVEQIAEDLEPGEHRDWMHYIRAVLAMQLDDFPVVHDQLDALISSDGTSPKVLAQAMGLMAFLCCRQYPDRSRELSRRAEEVVTTHGLAGEYVAPAAWAAGCLALYENRAGDSLPDFERSYALLSATMRPTNHVVMAGLALAATHVLVGDPQRALEILDSSDWSSSVWDSSSIVRALALTDLDRAAEAADLVFGFGHEALKGRLSRKSNDALVGMAALAINRGEAIHAWVLLQQAASPKTPFTIALAEGLADRLGHGDDLRLVHRGRQRPLSELDASAHLQAELDRLRLLR